MKLSPNICTSLFSIQLTNPVCKELELVVYFILFKAYPKLLINSWQMHFIHHSHSHEFAFRPPRWYWVFLMLPYWSFNFSVAKVRRVITDPCQILYVSYTYQYFDHELQQNRLIYPQLWIVVIQATSCVDRTHLAQFGAIHVWHNTECILHSELPICNCENPVILPLKCSRWRVEGDEYMWVAHSSMWTSHIQGFCLEPYGQGQLPEFFVLYLYWAQYRLQDSKRYLTHLDCTSTAQLSSYWPNWETEAQGWPFINILEVL